jgi:hypothetical protein
MNSVDHLEIQSFEAISTCRSYFPNACRLTVSDELFTKSGYLLSTELDRIIRLRQLTTLNINIQPSGFAKIIELLFYTSNVNTLNISSLGHFNDLVELQQPECFRLVSKLNNIMKIRIVSHITMELIRFLVALCPRLRHLTIVTFTDDLKSVLPYLFSTETTDIRCLTSLHIIVLEKNVAPLRNFIESEKLLKDYLIHADYDMFAARMYLWR